ncbi:hypothetical protein BCR42DRAFT_391538 [Absidia repens]|uniref:Uncharacterized protein n=1 Tax=Absidia repens TaxID=90262 RepID=A0A1X2IKE2_9FUNG|nr:hypothetical protein BCR42DRAFT_391538 [Absidia repens]
MLSFTSLMAIGMVIPWLPMTVAQSSAFPASTNTTATPLSLFDEKFTLFSWPASTDDVTMVDQSFTFHLDKSAVLQLIDYKHPGDVFHLFDNGYSLGKTTRPTSNVNGDVEYAETPERALADMHHRFSKGQVLLSEGDHFITIKVLKSSANTAANTSGGAIRLIKAPLALQQLYKKDHDDDDYDEEDDDDYDNEYEKEDEYEDDEEQDDGYDYTMTMTVVVPPITPDLWIHRTEPRVTMMPVPAGARLRNGIMPIADQVNRYTAVTFTPPA